EPYTIKTRPCAGDRSNRTGCLRLLRCIGFLRFLGRVGGGLCLLRGVRRILGRAFFFLTGTGEQGERRHDGGGKQEQTSHSVSPSESATAAEQLIRLNLISPARARHEVCSS